MNKACILILLVTAAVAAMAQAPQKQIPPQAGHIVVTIDSITTDGAYLMVTIMNADFTPFDYEMLPTRRGSMSVTLRTPPASAPFSITAYEDVNLNHRLDLNQHLTPTEPSIVKHCQGGEQQVTLTLIRYDQLLHQDTIP